jgi:hypothetical protein
MRETKQSGGQRRWRRRRGGEAERSTRDNDDDYEGEVWMGDCHSFLRRARRVGCLKALPCPEGGRANGTLGP